MRDVGKYWGRVDASPRSPRYLQAASCGPTPEHVKWPLLHLPSLSRILDMDLDLFARGSLPVSLAFRIPKSRLPRHWVCLSLMLGPSGTILPVGLVV
jgi:hypothetical protein